MNRILVSLLLAAVALPQLAQARDRDRHAPYGYAPQVLRCESIDHRDRYCPADTRGGVRLVRQESNADCVPGRTWGYDRGGVWVTRGCRARFELGGRYRSGPPGYAAHPGHGYGQRPPRLLRCESHDNRPNFCRVPGGFREADVHRRLSRAECEYGYSWGLRRDGVWVDRGCRADFAFF
ncbi:MAG TPA: DUF3011 domain-containing protein [Arenimonas sp.]|nr:DUF3011 domain-containing protein [Arenimonas sp.]